MTPIPMVALLSIFTADAKTKSDAVQVVFHKDLFTSVVLFFIVCAVWGLFLFARSQAPSGSYLGALIIGEGLIILQGLSGLVLVATGYKPHDGLHWLYGIVLLFTLPVIYGAWAQKRSDRMAALYYALGCILIVLIAAVRSSGTG